ncbi:MAG: DUF1801 domain-containing protein, partial [Bacteroidota bacterium]
LLVNEFMLTAKITFKNPCYYKHSWICYLKPQKSGSVELAFLRGNELSNASGLLENHGRKQVRSLQITDLKDIPLAEIKQTITEAVYLDETVPYESKRKRK